MCTRGKVWGKLTHCRAWRGQSPTSSQDARPDIGEGVVETGKDQDSLGPLPEGKQVLLWQGSEAGREESTIVEALEDLVQEVQGGHGGQFPVELLQDDQFQVLCQKIREAFISLNKTV